LNSEVKGVIVSVIALIIAGGMSALNFNQVQEAKEELVIQNEIQTDYSERIQDLEVEIEKLKNIEAPEQYDDQAIRAKLVELENHIVALNQNANYTINQIRNINNELIVAKASLNKMTQAVPQEEAMFSLILLKSDGTIVSNGEFLQSETVYISGKYDGKDTNYDLLIKRAGQLVLKKMELNMPTDGVFSYYFNEGHDQPVGTYTVSVVINGKIDTISFEIL
jgi:hypothetical protein